MARIINQDVDKTIPQKMDIHDTEISLADRAAFMLIAKESCSSDDFNCSEEELAQAMKLLSGDNMKKSH